MNTNQLETKTKLKRYKDAKDVLRDYALTLDLTDKEIDFMDYGDALVLVLDAFDVAWADAECNSKELVIAEE